ncbi:MAG: hypothetical protein KGO02_10315, partial [Alphaproteobacteria bacterium]|nr:hypothetical protein [Alphaproteobacteria bacterium]
ALWVAGLIAISAAALFAIVMIGTRMAGALTMGADALKYTGYIIAAVVIPLWLLLRFIYFLQQGQRTRPGPKTDARSAAHASSFKPRR